MYVRYEDAVRFMEVPKKIRGILPYGFSLDNPVRMREGVVLGEALRARLKTLSREKGRVSNTVDLIEHLKAIGKKAVKPCLVGDKEARLGNKMWRGGRV